MKAAAETVASLERPWWRRSGGLTVGVAVLAAVAAVAAVLGTTGGGTATAADHVDANAVGVIDSSGNITQQTDVGAAPGAVSADDNAALEAGAAVYEALYAALLNEPA